MKKVISVSVLTISFLSLFVIKVLSSHDWDAKSFILLRPENLPVNQNWGVGYDGQISYAIAVNPWNPTNIKNLTAYRYQRILYPLLIWLISLGNEAVIPWVMIGINLASTFVLCIIFCTLIQKRGQSPWFGMIFVFFLGYLLTIRMNLMEPLAFTLALGGWLAYEEDKLNWAIVLFSLSGLTKEVGLVFPAAIIMWELLRKNWRRAFSLIGCFLPYVAWFAILYNWLGISQTQIEQSRLIMVPFWGLRYVRDLPSIIVVGLWIIVPAALSIILTVWHIFREGITQKNFDSLLLFCNSIFVLVIPRMSWEDPIAILRLGLGMLLVLIIWYSNFYPRLLPYLSALYLPSGIVMFLIPGMF